MNYTVNYDLTRTRISGNTTVQITPNPGYDLPSSITVTNGVLSSWNSTTGIAVLSSASDNTVIDCVCAEQPPSSSNSLMFYVNSQQATPFTLTKDGGKTWDGELYYYDVANSIWNVWDGTTISGQWDGTKTVLYIRGVGNTLVTGSSGGQSNRLYISSSGYVMVSGNTEVLLGWETVAAGMHPVMSSFAFKGLFYKCGSLRIDDLVCGGDILSEGCYYAAFEYCYGLTTPPSLPSTNLAVDCYNAMFEESHITSPPSLPATELAAGCYRGMFRDCSHLTSAPSLPATTLTRMCYRYMFYGCSSLATPPSLPATTLAE